MHTESVILILYLLRKGSIFEFSSLSHFPVTEPTNNWSLSAQKQTLTHPHPHGEVPLLPFGPEFPMANQILIGNGRRLLDFDFCNRHTENEHSIP